MRQASEIQVEDMITARMRRDDPDIERIGVRQAKDGWRCYWVWLMKDAPRLSTKEREAILAKANLILADLEKDFAIVRTRKPSPNQGLTAYPAALFVLADRLGPLQS